MLVQVFHSQNETRQNEAHPNLAHLFKLFDSLPKRVTDERVDITTRGPLHHEVQVSFVLKSVVEGSNEGTSRLLEYSFFESAAVGELAAHHFCLNYSLNRVLLEDCLLPVFLELCQKHLAEPTSSNAVSYLETAPFDLLVGRSRKVLLQFLEYLCLLWLSNGLFFKHRWLGQLFF